MCWSYSFLFIVCIIPIASLMKTDMSLSNRGNSVCLLTGPSNTSSRSDFLVFLIDPSPCNNADGTEQTGWLKTDSAVTSFRTSVRVRACWKTISGLMIAFSVIVPGALPCCESHNLQMSLSWILKLVHDNISLGPQTYIVPKMNPSFPALLWGHLAR